MSFPSFIDRISDLAAAGILASFGGAAQALYQSYKGSKPFSLISFIVCVLLSFFVGQVVGSLIPETLSQYHDGILLMSGFSVFPLLDLFNAYISKLIVHLLGGVTMGVSIDEPAKAKAVEDKKENNNG
jgi:hypothetical protein